MFVYRAFLFEVNGKRGAFVNFAFCFYSATHSINLIFGDEQANSFGIRIVVEGFIHSEKILAVSL